MGGVCHDRWVDRRALILFGVLSAVWGASYMFIEIGLEDGLPPAAIVAARTGLAALVLCPIAARMGALRELRGLGGPIFLLAAMQVAGPFMLITVGQQEISSSLAGILIATAPIFTYLLAFAVAHEERTSAVGLAGVAIGLVGVALLLGVDREGGGAALLGGLAVVVAALGYAMGAHYLKRRLARPQPVGVVTATLAATALLAAPFVALDPPGEAPGAGAVAAIGALGVLGTGLAFVIYYWLIARIGASRTSLVAYVATGFAVLYGVVLLNERFTLATAGGLLLIVGGSWLAVRGGLPRRQLPAGSIDVAAAGEADRGAEAPGLERGPERRDRLARRAVEA
jgi:drug/metabolite transporter (DMT)-like permease